MKDKTKETLDRLKYIVFNEIIDYGEELSLSECKLLLDYITNLQEENNHLKQNKKRTLEYIENNRIREKCIVDINTLEGLLNE